MHMATKNDIFNKYKKEYYKATKARKGEILTVVSEVSGLTRKGSIKRFKGIQTRDPAHQETRGRPVIYTKDVDAALFAVWDAANQPCGTLVYPLIREYIAVLNRDGMWKHGDEATGKLLAMKERTVRRRVESFQRDRPTAKGLSGTKPSELKKIIPIFKGPWDTCVPGEGQIDTVAHCGGSLLGDFIWSVCYTDAATYWVILRAQWNKGQEATRNSIVAIKDRSPVRLFHLHPDTGGEFINWHLKDWCDQPAVGIKLTRSEPGQKNDNMYVEERNGHVVRKYLGYERLGCLAACPLVNEYYDVLALYLNHFQAVRRTTEKVRVGAKYQRKYEKNPLTPYQRMITHSQVSKELRVHLKQVHEAQNPLVLKQKLDTLYGQIMRQTRDHGLGNCACGRA